MQKARGQSHLAFAGLVILVTLAVYTQTLAPDITWSHDGQDGGDLITAIMSDGVPHPPGYPTYLLLASPLVRLPCRTPAWRTNLFSAICAAGASGLTALAVMQIAEDVGRTSRVAKLSGITAGLMLAFSPVLWSQAVITEVYTLVALLAALLLFLTVLLQTRPSALRASAFGGLFGLALGASLTLSLSGLPILFILSRRWKMLAWILGGLVIGLGVFAALPLRALNQSPVNWGDPFTLNGFWWLVSAQLYREYVFALPLDSMNMRTLAWASAVARQFTPIGALISGWGFVRLWNVNPRLAGATLAMFAGWSVFAIGYNTTDSYVHLIPAFVVMAIWLGKGLAELSSKVNWPTGALWGLMLVLTIAQVVSGWSSADLRADRVATDFGQAIMAQAPERAILLTAQDAHTFTLWYYRYVLKQRSDVTIVDQRMLDMPWYRAVLAREHGIASSPGRDLLAELEFGRPVCPINETRLECK